MRVARDQLRSLLGAWRNRTAQDNAVLVMSEVVTNAVRHGLGGMILITMTVNDSHLLAQVHDEGAHMPMRRSADEQGGRGLELIDLLSDRSGVHEGPDGGKTVWFEIDATPR